MLVRVAVTVRTTPTSVGDAAPDSEQSPHWPAQSRALSFDVRQALGSREEPAEHRPQQRGELPTSAARIARVSDVIELRFIQAFGEQAVKSSIHSGCHRSPLEGCNAEPLDLDVWRPCAVVFAGAPACFDNCSRSHSHLEREAFFYSMWRGSANQPTEHVFDPHPERDHGLDVRGRARAEGTGDLDGRAGLTALRERDGVGATLVREGLPSRTLGGVERTRAGALARLLAQMGIRDARTRDELHQLESELVRDEFVMRQTGLGVGGAHASQKRRPRDSARRAHPCVAALARGVRVPA